MNKMILSLFFLALACNGQNVIDSDARVALSLSGYSDSRSASATRPSGSLLWKSSIGALAATETADILTSRGRIEDNPLLRAPGGGFDTGKGVALKAAVVGPLVLAEWALKRHHPERRKGFAWVNFAISGFNTGVAIHNEK